MEKVISFPFVGTEELSKLSKEEFQEFKKKFEEILKDYLGISFMTFIDTCMVTKIAWHLAIEKVSSPEESKNYEKNST
ncbi:MAG: hypothetical protein N3A56_00090 [Thermodesulfobacteriaceae bacterium]|nr:hypothetical protein [Thermodesulfobacteriaceae bacterium]